MEEWALHRVAAWVQQAEKNLPPALQKVPVQRKVRNRLRIQKRAEALRVITQPAALVMIPAQAEEAPPSNLH
jgi:hypothetical protein